MSEITRVDAKQAKALLANGACIVDVREPAEFRSTYIEHAQLHPLGTVSFNNIQNNDQTIIIYCQKGMRGEKACQKILAENPKANVVNLIGGIEAWQKEGFTTLKGDSKVLPLDRQVQITIGSLVLCFALLGYFQHSNFIFAAAFMGAGLIFAGLSGFCGMARIIAMAPWNR